MPRFTVSVSSLLMAASLCGCGSHGAAGSAAGATATPLESASVGRGRTVFAANCATCHGAAGEGGQIGPPLRDELRRRTPAYVVEAIANPTPPMPKLVPAQMSKQDLLDVAAFVEQL